MAALTGEYKEWALTEEEAPKYKGKWREAVFHKDIYAPLDLEIGTGNGTHFAHHCKKFPERSLVGLELKYKPLIQSIRRAYLNGSINGRMVRYHANILPDLFAEGEVDDVYIHFPDPWPKKKHWKNRLIQPEFLNQLYKIMKPGTYLEFKTDSLDYFEWSKPIFEQGPFALAFITHDLHQSEQKEKNFVTQFESIFLRKGQPIYYALLKKK